MGIGPFVCVRCLSQRTNQKTCRRRRAPLACRFMSCEPTPIVRSRRQHRPRGGISLRARARREIPTQSALSFLIAEDTAGKLADGWLGPAAPLGVGAYEESHQWQ